MTRTRIALHLEPDRSGWQDAAACRGLDAEMFHPNWYELPGGGGLSRTAREAIAVCRLCGVNRECLEFALRVESSEPRKMSGIYGGLTPQQRATLARRSA